MNKKEVSNSHSVRTSLLVSYILVLMMPILLNIAVFFVSLIDLQKQIELSIAIANEQLVSFIDTYIEEIHTGNSAIILSSSSQNLINYTGRKKTTYQLNQLRALQKELVYRTTVCDYIAGIYAVFPKSHTILTEQSIYDDENFAYRCRSSLGMTTEEWEDFLNFDGYERFSILHSRLDERDHILIAQKNRAINGKSPEMLVVTEFSTDSVRSILNSLSVDGRALNILYDRESGSSILSNEVMLSELSMEKDDLTASNIPGMRSSSLDTAAENLQCIVLTPKSSYFSSFSLSIAAMFIGLPVSLLIGIWMIRYLTRKQYTPLETLTKNLLSIIEQDSHTTEVNEYEQIEEALTHLLHKRTGDAEQDMLLRQSFTENVLRIILSKHIHRDSIIYRHAVNNGILLDGNRFLVMLYIIEDIDNTLDQLEAEYDNVISSLLDTIVCAAAQDSSDSRYKRYAAEFDNRIACIVSCPDDIDEAQIMEDMQRDSSRTQAFLNQKFGFVLSVAVSGIHQELENVSLCYEEAKETAEYMETMGLSTQTLLHSSIPASASEPISFSTILEKEKQFGNCIRAYDFTASKQLLQEIIDSLELGHCPPAEARLRIYGLISVIGSTLEEIKPFLDEEQITIIKPEYYLHTKDVNVICHQLMQFSDQLIEAGCRQKKTASASRENTIVQYVNEHFTDPNLNISLIADLFDMSPSYFSRIFKKNTGMGLLDYVHQRRIELAKELMQQTPALSLKEIAEKIGYSSPLAMNRAFRRYEGVSPSSFREHIHQQDL